MKTIKTISILALSTVLFFACEDKKKEANETVETEEIMEVEAVEEVQPNIVEVASANDSFSTLVAAVVAADLATTLSGDGPFTVFAPTNDAFAKLPEGTVASLLEPGNKATLASILTYHVVSGKFEAAAVIDAINQNNGAFTVTTVQGGTLTLSLSDEKVMLKDEKGGMSTVVIADVASSNGVIHAVDTVVMPK
ncbi:fasciclin domain-containing protein [Winogradskyella sp. UBA3174]|uniref:fasciclin domain-containing protein n=1 Tax=Winogradskyella sp. UBA3174 TaxID=1947785 RepID=UPI0025DE8B4B|nr:fasciclin domain-containing protein [Winogradskyella sp. UBA3174]|tara:strand:+ start:1208 stop:1789 length:582 start_codon:yes stop_codon:yes gene_type:complete